MDRVPERVGLLVSALIERHARVILPTPAVSEFLVSAGPEAGAYLDNIREQAVFDIRPFDLAAAVEAAAATRAALARGDKRSGATGSWQKVKVDRQIVAVAKVHGAEVLYSDDTDIRVLGKASGIRVVRTKELPLPERGSGMLFESR